MGPHYKVVMSVHYQYQSTGHDVTLDVAGMSNPKETPSNPMGIEFVGITPGGSSVCAAT